MLNGGAFDIEISSHNFCLNIIFLIKFHFSYKDRLSSMHYTASQPNHFNAFFKKDIKAGKQDLVLILNLMFSHE